MSDIRVAPDKKRWLILAHGFNMDGRAASLTVTDKIPHLLNAGVQPIVLSAITGIKDERFPHHQFLAWGPSGFRFDFRDRKSTRLNSSHVKRSRMPSSA